MALTSATPAQLAEFITKYGYTMTGNEGALLSLSFAFLRTLPVCDSVLEKLDDLEDGPPIAADLVEAQCFIAYAISEEGGEFNPAELAETKTLTKEGIGRGALTEEFKINDELAGTDPVSMLKRVPLAHGLIKNYLCTHAGPVAYVV